MHGLLCANYTSVKLLNFKNIKKNWGERQKYVLDKMYMEGCLQGAICAETWMQGGSGQYDLGEEEHSKLMEQEVQKLWSGTMLSTSECIVAGTEWTRHKDEVTKVEKVRIT